VGCDHKTVGKYRDEQERTGEIPQSEKRTVSKYRGELEATDKIYQSEKRTGADGRTIDTSNIGGGSSSRIFARKKNPPRPDRLVRSRRAWPDQRL